VTSGEPVLAQRLDPRVAPYLRPAVRPRVRQHHPALRRGLHEAPTADLVARLGRGELGVLLRAFEAPLDGLVAHALFADPFVVALPTAHRLAGRERLDKADLAGEPVVRLEDAHGLRAQALAVRRTGGADDLVDVRATSLTTLVSMGAGGAGVTVLPDLALGVEGRRAGVAIVRFGPRGPHRTIGLAWRATSGRAAEFRTLGASLTPPKCG